MTERAASLLVASAQTANPFDTLARWMATRFGEWANETYDRPQAAKTFNQLGLSTGERAAVISNIRNQAGDMYIPGLVTMAQIFQCVPSLAVREGVKTVDEWRSIASQAREFGKTLTGNGTLPQALVRAYLEGRDSASVNAQPLPLDPARMRLDEVTGINSVTPIEDLMAAGVWATNKYLDSALATNACPALQGYVEGLLPSPTTMYDASWDFYGEVVGRYLYPLIEIDPLTIPEATRVDHRTQKSIGLLALSLMDS